MTTPIAAGLVDVDVGPVAWAVFAENGNIRIWSSVSEPVRKLAEAEGMKLVPLYAIPEGWQLAPKEPTKEMRIAGQERLPGEIAGRAAYAADAYRAMLDCVTPNA